MLQVHGTYPFDGGRWWRVRELEPEEAMKMAGCDQETRDRWPDRYPWLNKGYIILGELGQSTPTGGGFGLHMAELMTDGEVGGPLPPGTQAVYIHDGSFSLIQVRD